jgi:hypothetical protein
MFSKLSRFRLFGAGRAQQLRATAEYRMDAHSLRGFTTNSHRVRRPALVCHWQTVPSTGALECVWRSVAATDEPQPRRSTDARASAGRPFMRAA